MIEPMAVFLDDEQIDGFGSNLGSVLAAAQERLDPLGRVVVEVQLNGQTLLGEALDQQQNAPLDDGELRLYSADPVELATTTLRQARNELQRARQEQIDAAELIQRDELAPAMEKVQQMIEIWQQTQQAVLQSTQLMQLQIDDMRVGDEPMTEQTQRLLEQVQALQASIVAGDTVGLADALAYEWPETCDRWDGVIEALIQEIEGRHAV